MFLEGPKKVLAAKVAGLVHADKKSEAAEEINEFCKLGLSLDGDPKKFIPVLQHWFHFLMGAGAIEEAAMFLWTPTLFTPYPKFTQSLWELFDETSHGLVMGAASCSKSFSLGVRFFLEWLRDPEWTTVRVLGPSEAHLSSNLFSHLVSLHSSASIPLPGEVGDLWIGLDRRNQLSSIKGVVIPIGAAKKAGRLQGQKRKPRPFLHPVFGALSRLLILIDEVENVPKSLWGDISNILSNIQEEGDTSGFVLIGAYNPTVISDEVAKRAEPPLGWNSFDPETSYRWKSIRGWDVLRLSGEQSENVIQDKIVYPGLQTKSGLEQIARNAGGKMSAGYFSMGLGCYPPQGTELTIIPPGLLQKCRAEFIFYDDPRPIGAVDLALEGGDTAVYALGRWGRVTGIKYQASLEHPQGHKVMFKDKAGQNIVRWGLQADQVFALPKGDTVAMKNAIIETNRRAGVRGEYFACDRTGGGSGVADLIKYEWSPSIHDLNYSSASSKDKIMAEDTKTCNEEFERVNSEIWFCMRAWLEFGYLLLSPSIDMSKLTQQLTGRKFRKIGGKTRVEPKSDFVNRGHESPDEADALTLLVHAARKGSGVTLSMNLEELPASDDSDGWMDEMVLRGGARIDESNRTQFLDDDMRPMHEAIL